MKKVFTEQKSANRGPKKHNLNFIQTLPVLIRREQNIFGADHKEWDRTYEDKIRARKAREERYNKARNGE